MQVRVLLPAVGNQTKYNRKNFSEIKGLFLPCAKKWGKADE